MEDERRRRKERLAAALRIFGQFGFGAGVITARDPERLDHVWVNPPGLDLRQIRVRDLVLVDHGIEEISVHSRIHAARPDVVSVAHARSPYGSVWSTLGRPLDPLTQDACAFYEDVAFDVETLGERKAAILANHGLVTVGHTVDEAAWWFVTMERSCQVQLLAETAGTPVAIETGVAQQTYGATGGHQTGWRQFQPLYDWIVAQQPELLEE